MMHGRGKSGVSCTDLCGGREVTRVPTATKAPSKAGAISRCKSGPGKACFTMEEAR
jgi:hypothetical protein